MQASLTPPPRSSSGERRDATARRAIALAYGVGSHATFVLAILLMVTALYQGMQSGRGTVAAPWSWVANAILLLQFPLVHSVLLTPRGRTWVARAAPLRLGARLATTIYAWIAALQLVALFALWTPSGQVWWSASGPLRIVLTILYVGSWALLAAALWQAGLGLQTGALGWRAVFRGRSPRYPPMPRTGLFALTRQPVYVAFAVTPWTTPTWTPDQLAVALSFGAYCYLGPRLKEQRSLVQYGEAFRAYQREVPYWVPRLTKRRTRPKPRSETALYERLAPVWWAGSDRTLRLLQNLVPARLRHFDAIAAPWAGRRVLDLGCGGGFMAEALALRAARVIGVDPCAAALEAARAHAAAAGLDIDYLEGRGEAIPLPDRSVDAVVCVDVLEHVDDLPRVLFEVARVLGPGGVFLFDTVNSTMLARLALITVGEQILRLLPPGTHDPEKFIATATLRRLLSERGFTVGPFVGLAPVGLNRRLDLTFGRVPTKQVLYLGHATLAPEPMND